MPDLGDRQEPGRAVCAGLQAGGIKHAPVFCRNCGLPIEKIIDPWGGEYGWHHSTISKEVNIDGMDVQVAQTFCPDDQGEAEPIEE